MKITGGMLRGRNVTIPPKREEGLRPTSSRVREALFNIINAQKNLNETKVADICCGSGLLGFEAISRGASFVTFIDHNSESLALTKENARSLGIIEQCEFKHMDATNLSPLHKKYDLILTDPPYQKQLLPKILQSITEQNWLEKGGYLVAELPKSETTPLTTSLELWKEKNYGNTKLIFWYNKQ